MEEIAIENRELREEVEELKERLREYTYGESKKKYYEANKEKIIEKSNARLERLKSEDPERLREYRRRAYDKQKEKKKYLSKYCEY